jgi:hypothetical protein
MENIVKNYSKKTTSIMFVVLILLLLFGGACLYKIISLKKDYNDISDILKIKQDSLKIVRNENGDLVGRVETFELTVKQLKENEKYILGENSDLKSEVGNLNNLVSYYKGKAVISGQGEGSLTPVKPDEAYVKPKDPDKVTEWKNFSWNNDYLNLLGTVYDCKDYGFKYSYTLMFETYTYKKKLQEKKISRLFGRKSLITDIKFKDQDNLRPVSATSITIKPDKNFFSSGWFKFGVGFLTGFVSNSLIYGSYRK